jgi:2-methylcitrate dehydratase
VLSARFPAEHACRVTIVLRDGRTFTKEKSDYLGFPTRPAGWSEVEDKFRRLAVPVAGEAVATRIVETVRDLEHRRVEELCSLLGRVGDPRSGGVAT